MCLLRVESEVWLGGIVQCKLELLFEVLYVVLVVDERNFDFALFCLEGRSWTFLGLRGFALFCTHVGSW